MSVIDEATVPPAASATVAREDGSDHRRRRQQQQQQQQHGSTTSVGAGGATFDDLERRGSWTPDTDASAVSCTADNGVTDRTPLLTRRAAHRDEDRSGYSDRGPDIRVVVDGQVNLAEVSILLLLLLFISRLSIMILRAVSPVTYIGSGPHQSFPVRFNRACGIIYRVLSRGHTVDTI